MKLQKQLSRKYNNEEYAKWVVVIPPEKVKELGWKEGDQLAARRKKKRLVIERL